MNAAVPPPQETPALESDITENDKLLAALSYPVPIVAIVILLSETNKARPFQRFHAAQALAFWVVLGAITFVLCIVTAVVGILCFPVLWLISLWPAYQAYQGEYIELPLVTDFLRKQGWV